MKFMDWRGACAQEERVVVKRISQVYVCAATAAQCMSCRAQDAMRGGWDEHIKGLLQGVERCDTRRISHVTILQ